MPRFDLNLSLFFADLPFEERPAAAAALGFSAVEAWWPFDRPDPPQKTLDALARRFTDAGVTLAALNVYGGDLAAGDRGIAAHPGLESQFRDGVAAAFAFADAAGGCPVFNALYGNRLPGVPAPEQDEVATANLAHAAAAAAGRGATVVLEPLNAFENPTYPYHRSAAALERIAAIEAATGQRLALLYDCYHLQRMEGNLIATIREQVDRIGHVQIADSPGRGEPGTGEINYPRVLAALDDAGYRGRVGLEYRPTRDPQASLAWLTDRGAAPSR